MNNDIAFEGPEKNLQVMFTLGEISKNRGRSLRDVKQSRWEKMLDFAKCKILSRVCDNKCTAFILSESSLFVFDSRIILKTCGTTPLLKAISDIVRIGNEIGLIPAAVLYWRKNFTNPQVQDRIHRHFSTEVSYLNSHLEGGKVVATQVGPKNGDHFYFYFNELISPEKKLQFPNTFEVKMHELDPNVSKNFIWDEGRDRPQILKELFQKLPGMEIDEYFFNPCGYSMNGIKDGEYDTIHITPEAKCSYVSFETTCDSYISTQTNDLNVVNSFKPACFTTINITSGAVSAEDEHNLSTPSNYKLVAKEKVSLGRLNVEFSSFETTESHPLMAVSRRRIERCFNAK